MGVSAALDAELRPVIFGILEREATRSGAVWHISPHAVVVPPLRRGTEGPAPVIMEFFRMADLKPVTPEVLLHISQTLQVPMKGLVASIELLDEGGTVPFIARYRKEATGNLDEVQIRSIAEKLAYLRELQNRRATVLASIEEQGKLTSELRARIEVALEKSELEDLYLPYKPKRRTRATIARAKGLEPLAVNLWEQRPSDTPLAEFAATFVNAELGVANVKR